MPSHRYTSQLRETETQTILDNVFGHVVSSQGLKANPAKVEAVNKMPVPTCIGVWRHRASEKLRLKDAAWQWAKQHLQVHHVARTETSSAFRVGAWQGDDKALKLWKIQKVVTWNICCTCQTRKQKETLMSHELANWSWSWVDTDLFACNGHQSPWIIIQTYPTP